MKTIKIWMPLLVAILFLFLVSCNDDDDENQDNDAIKELLVAHPWKIDKQLVDGNEVDLISSEDDPYVINFEVDGVFENANFTTWYNDEEWEIVGNKLVIDGDPITIQKITSSELVVSYVEDNASKELYFVEEETADAFPGLAIFGKSYRVLEAQYGLEEQTPENNPILFRQKVLIEEECITMSSKQLNYSSWDILSGSFVFVEEMEGYDLKLADNGDILLVQYDYEDTSLKSGSMSKNVLTYRECNLWDFLDGPEWVLNAVEKEGVVINENLPLPLGTIWYFNSYTNMVEERDDQSDVDIEYMGWNFVGTPNNEKVEITISVEEGELQKFTMLKGNIAELELETVIDSETFLLMFEVEVDQ